MDPFVDTPLMTVSNLTPSWEDAAMDGGGSFAPAEAEAVVEQVVEAAEGARPVIERPVVERPVAERPVGVRAFEAPVEPPMPKASPFSLDRSRIHALEESWVTPAEAALEAAGAEAGATVAPIAGAAVDYDALRRRDIAKELLRARLVDLAEQRERRSAYEIVFILLAAAVAVLLAAPPLVQVLLAAHGTQV